MNPKNCECGTMRGLASDPLSPIEYDERLNEFHLISRDEKVHYLMYFCFSCGGKLPDSKRMSLFTEPSVEEIKEVTDLLAKVSSIQQVKQALGDPDETVPAAKNSRNNGKSEMKTKRHHRYVLRWRTLDLILNEHADGSIDGAFTGKYKGDLNGPGPKNRFSKKKAGR